MQFFAPQAVILRQLAGAPGYAKTVAANMDIGLRSGKCGVLLSCLVETTCECFVANGTEVAVKGCHERGTAKLV